MPAIAPVLRIRAMICSRSGCSSGSPPEIVITEVPSRPRSSIRRSISSSGTGSETSSNSLQYVQARLHRRIGTICAIYGCPVETTAEPMDANSRTLRVTAFQRRFALIGRLPVVVIEAEDIVTLKYIEPSQPTWKRRPEGRPSLTSPTYPFNSFAAGTPANQSLAWPHLPPLPPAFARSPTPAAALDSPQTSPAAPSSAPSQASSEQPPSACAHPRPSHRTAAATPQASPVSAPPARLRQRTPPGPLPAPRSTASSHPASASASAPSCRAAPQPQQVCPCSRGSSSPSPFHSIPGSSSPSPPHPRRASQPPPPDCSHPHSAPAAPRFPEHQRTLPTEVPSPPASPR